MAYQTPRKKLVYGDIAYLRRSVTVERGGRMVGSGLKRVNGENKGKNEGRLHFSLFNDIKQQLHQCFNIIKIVRVKNKTHLG